MMPAPGQAAGFSGYGGIEDPDLYMAARYGHVMKCVHVIRLPWIPHYEQAQFEPHAPNCVLVAVTRILDGYRTEGYDRVSPDPAEIYPIVRQIGVRYGYNPEKSGFWHDLFVYPPWSVGRIERDAWRAYGYSKTRAGNRYLFKKQIILAQLKKSRPILFNLSIGDYPGHTLTVIGMRVYQNQSYLRKLYLWEVVDGWSDKIRFIDASRLFWIPASVTILSRLDRPDACPHLENPI